MSNFIWGSDVPANATQSTLTDQASLPVWYQEYLRGLVNKSAAIADVPYQQYQGPRIAAFTPQQQQAFNQVQNMQGQYQAPVNQAINQTQTGGQYDLNTFKNNFFNPYATGAMDVLAQKSNQNFNEQIMPQVMGAFTGGGQFGSSRNARMMDQAVRDQQSNLLNAQNQVYNQAWTGGQANYSDWANKNLSSAMNLGNLASQQQAMGLKDTTALEAIGRQQQQQTQANYDLAYQDSQAALNAPKDNAAWLSAIVRGTAPPVTAQSQNTNYQNYIQSSPLASAVGGLGMGATAITQPAQQSGLTQMQQQPRTS